MTRPVRSRKPLVPVQPPLLPAGEQLFRRLKADARREDRRRGREALPPAPPAPPPLDLVPKPRPAKVPPRTATDLLQRAVYDPASLALAVGQDPDHFRVNPWPTWRPRHRARAKHPHLK